MSQEEVPNSELTRKYHTRRRVTPDEVTAIKNVGGIQLANADGYEIDIRRAKLFTWAEIEPFIQRVFGGEEIWYEPHISENWSACNDALTRLRAGGTETV